MSLNVPLLRASFDIVVARAPNLTHRFYEVLFDRYPQAKPLFGRNTQRAQEDMLTGALVAVMDHLEDASWLEETLGALGNKHVGYGVTPAMYAWVGDALLTTLGEVAGADWTPELAKAWSDAYGAIAGLMTAGSKAAAA